MGKIISNLLSISQNNDLVFAEPFYRSTDGKTIMGEVPFEQILFLDYRDTDAGSNPREYTGLHKKTNLNILKSLLKDSVNMFRFLHSGTVVSLTNPLVKDVCTLRYDDCCLTNGNQTRFIILVLTFLKILSDDQELKKINQKDFQSFIDSEFKNSDRVKRIAQYTRVSKINEIINFLKQNNKYHDCFTSINLETFLKSRIRVQINLINAIKEGIGGKLDEYSVGTLIAEANNDTQKVKVDDIFGNKYRKDLEEKLFNKFIEENKGKVNIEYRYGEVTGKGEKVHILTLLRPIVATGILTKEKDIFLMTNQRDPIYRLFEKFLGKGYTGETINAIKKLIPYLYDLRKKYVEVILEQHKRDLIREYKEKAISEELGDTIISDDIGAAHGDDGKIEKIMRTAVNYNIEHIIPVLVFRIRKLFIETSVSEKLDLIIPAAKRDAFFKSLIKAIYDNYVKMRLKGLSTSLTTEVRSRKFYDFGTEAYTVWKEQENWKETDYIERHRHVLS